MYIVVTHPLRLLWLVPSAVILFYLLASQPIFAQEQPNDITSRTPQLTGGRPVQPGELDAVGQLNGGSCTATLFTDNLVLTAAHCVCGDNGCAERASFTLRDVFPIDNPATLIDESLTRTNVTLNGSVRVHPEFGQRGWLSEDIAVVALDQPASQVTENVSPIAIEQPYNTPLAGDPLTLVGYGSTGDDCSLPGGNKLALTLNVSRASAWWIVFTYDGQGSCPGDSGGPVLNSAGQIVGVASWHLTDNGTGYVRESTYRPTSYSYNWLFGLENLLWGILHWIPIENAGINSHAPYAWCPEGEFLVSFDLDGNRDLSPYDSPVVGQAQCATLAMTNNPQWGACSWMPVDQAGINSHAPTPSWCQPGSFLAGFDLDGPRNYSDQDSPVVGQALCCSLAGTEQNEWGSSYWVPVGAIASHNPGEPWCTDGAFLTQFDLDQRDADIAPDGYDAPIVGQAKCSRPYPSTIPVGVWAEEHNDQLILRWDEVLGSTAYHVYRAAAEHPEILSMIGSTHFAQYTDNSASPFVEYIYQVQSIGEQRQPSAFSAPVTAKLRLYKLYLPFVD